MSSSNGGKPVRAKQLADRLPTTAFAFRGYNVTNLGRTAELLAHPAYGSVTQRWLCEASQVCANICNRPVDLVDRVRRGEETTLDYYAEAVALVMSSELAQLELLRELFGVNYEDARLGMGYSLGEVAAVSASGVLSMEEALTPLLTLADECVELAHDVQLGVLFSRGRAIALDEVRRLCLHVNAQGQGVMGISAYLSPNSLLLMGQRDTLQTFKNMAREKIDRSLHVRINSNRWPPMHTPIIWERSIPNRSAVLMHTLRGGFTAPQPPILSLVTGAMSYNDFNAREILHRWSDHPQRLWEVVHATLAMGIETIIHVGPQPNIIPATYRRLRDNVEVQTRGSIGMRALSQAVRRPWLAKLLPRDAPLLRASLLTHVVLEDWLLAQEL